MLPGSSENGTWAITENFSPFNMVLMNTWGSPIQMTCGLFNTTALQLLKTIEKQNIPRSRLLTEMKYALPAK